MKNNEKPPKGKKKKFTGQKIGVYKDEFVTASNITINSLNIENQNLTKFSEEIESNDSGNQTETIEINLNENQNQKKGTKIKNIAYIVLASSILIVLIVFLIINNI